MNLLTKEKSKISITHSEHSFGKTIYAERSIILTL